MDVVFMTGKHSSPKAREGLAQSTMLEVQIALLPILLGKRWVPSRSQKDPQELMGNQQKDWVSQYQ